MATKGHFAYVFHNTLLERKRAKSHVYKFCFIKINIFKFSIKTAISNQIKL